MAIGGVLLVPAFLAVSVLAGPITLRDTFKCCRERRLVDASQFKPASNVDSLEACKRFCQTNNYGSPIYGVGGWQCVVNRNFLCPEVDSSNCPDDITQSRGYYRLYPVSSLVRISVSTVRNTTQANSSLADIDDFSRRDNSRILLGGQTIGQFSAQTLGGVSVSQSGSIITNKDTDLVRTANFAGNVNIDDFGGVVRASGTGTISIETVRTQIDRERTTQGNSTTDARESSNTEQDRSIGTVTDFFRDHSRTRGITFRTGTATQQNRGNSSSARISVTGGAELSAESFFGTSTPISASFQGANNNITATNTTSKETITTGANETVLTDTEDEGGSVRLLQKDGNGLLRTTASVAIRTGETRVVRAGTEDLESERTILEKEEVGIIDKTTNTSSGIEGSEEVLSRSNTERLSVNITRECPDCIAQNNEKILRRSHTDGSVRGSSRTNARDVNTVTTAGDQALVVRGSTSDERNSTLSESETDGSVVRTRRGQSEAECDRSKGACDQSLTTSGNRLVISSNTSTTDDTVHSKTSTIFIGSF